MTLKLSAHAVRFLALCLGTIALIGAAPAAAQVAASYTLLSNASASGSVQAPVGGNYQVDVSGTFGGTTVTINETVNGVTTALAAYTAATPGGPADPCFAIPANATVQAVVSGGSPSALYASLGGVGTCPAALAGNFAPTQVAVASTATSIVAARTGRQLVMVTNTSTTAIYLGPTAGVTTSTGQLLPGVVGASITIPYTGPLFGISATGTNTVTVVETY